MISSPSSSAGEYRRAARWGRPRRVRKSVPLTVEVRVGKMVGRAPEIHHREVELAGVLMHAGTAPDDLLELGHGAYYAVEHDEPAGLDIDAGGKKPARW